MRFVRDLYSEYGYTPFIFLGCYNALIAAVVYFIYYCA